MRGSYNAHAKKLETVQKAGVPPHSPMGSQVMLYDSPPISFASSMAWRWILLHSKVAHYDLLWEEAFKILPVQPIQ